MFGDDSKPGFAQEALDSLFGGGDAAPTDDPSQGSSDGGGSDLTKSLFGGGDDEPEALPEPAEDIPMEPHAVLEGDAHTLVVWLKDADRQPMAGAPYRLTAGDDVREGHADADGRVEEPNITALDTCILAWGDPLDDADGYAYGRELHLDTEGSDPDHQDRQLENLAYFGLSLDDRMASFQADYQGALQDVHDNGGVAPPASGDSTDSDAGTA
jgi:hypothetical protein